MTLPGRRAELVKAFRASGLTMAEMARREGVKYSTFAGWVVKSARGRRGSAAPVRFAEVKVPAAVATTVLEVRLPDGTVLRGSSAMELAALVRALRA